MVISLFAKLCANMYSSDRVMVVKVNFKMAAAAILDLLPPLFLAYRRIWIVVLYVPVKFCKSNSAELLSSVKNSKWLLFAIFNYYVAMLDHPRSLTGDRKLVFKFCVDQFCSFEDIVNRNFCKFGLKRLFGLPKFTFFGVLTPKH